MANRVVKVARDNNSVGTPSISESLMFKTM